MSLYFEVIKIEANVPNLETYPLPHMILILNHLL